MKRVSALPSLNVGVDRSEAGETLTRVRAARGLWRIVATSGEIGVFAIRCERHEETIEVRGYTVAVATARSLPDGCTACQAETLL